MPRKLCDGCSRPVSVCICEHLVSVVAPIEVVILQHPSEQKQALATVPLIERCLSPVSVHVGEDFSDEETIKEILKSPNEVRVVFPADSAQTWKIGASTSANDRQIKTLIFIDGTWRKAKRIWHTNPWLAQLPAVILTGMAPTAYKIRSSSVEGGVSTLEAVVGALNYLTASSDFDQLQKPFHAMIDLQIQKMGSEVFAAHYEQSDG